MERENKDNWVATGIALGCILTVGAIILGIEYAKKKHINIFDNIEQSVENGKKDLITFKRKCEKEFDKRMKEVLK